MKKSMLLKFLILVCFAGANAQETGATLVANAGLTATGASGSLAYSLGEPVVGTIQSGAALEQGFWASTTVVDEPLSISDFDLENSLSVYPNPVQDLLHLESNSEQLRAVDLNIYDQQGRMLQSWSLDLNADRAIDLSSLSSGIYLLRLEDAESSFQKTIKLLKH